MLCASTVMFAGTLIVGAVVSKGEMLTAKCTEAVFPRPSSAVHVTVVCPTGNVDPEAGRQLTGALAPRSVADGVVKDATYPLGEVASCEMLAGTLAGLMTGGVVSCTTTLKVAVESGLLPSLAVHCTGVVPMANVLPEAGAHVTGRAPVTASLAVGGV